ncbi:hypothetical protein [Pelistega suis]|uniref:PemK-like protein n=1 Tax=Pelistega suis TaxID=1631957 RepID=A0A849P4Q2_9BURK|nr:hypothetical protein [Pelistega suis]NOL51611.1 hypothetical protein [Pelistega suis]
MRGQCMLIPSGDNNHKHLFTVVIDPVTLPQTGSIPVVILVNFTSIRDDVPYDDACVVQAGEHPFIQHKSYVNYRCAREDNIAHINSLLDKGVFVKKEPCSQTLLEKIIAGALKSKRISRQFKQIIQDSIKTPT